MKRHYLGFLLAEFFVVGLVVLTFKLVAERLHAGAIAGTIFVGLGLLILISGLRNPAVRRSATFLMACVHLFVSALPLLITRLLNHSEAFGEVRIWGLPGPLFHQVSTWIYLFLMLATVFDLIRVSWKKK